MRGLTLSLAAGLALLGQPGHTAPARDHSWALLAGRLFPAIESAGAAPAQASGDAVLMQRRQRLTACAHAPDCVIHAALWSDAEIAEAVQLVERRLTPVQKRAATPETDVAMQVTRELKGLNSILQVYGLGTPPRYPTIDGPIEPPGNADFTARVADAVLLAEAGSDDPVAAFDPSVALAISLLDANSRDEAAKFEPLDQHYNAGAAAFARTANWKAFKYSAIIVLGVGPEDSASPISPRSKLNVQTAARRFQEGETAFIIVSGANVHPRGTPFVEAVEMRKALIERYGIPANRIVLEPYARHTTTNLRNATRRLVALGVPLDRDTIVVTNPEHSHYVESADYRTRNQSELGYLPGVVGRRLSPMEILFRPARISLTIDPNDPLDP